MSEEKTFNNDNRGASFVNDKGDNAARPDFRGEITVVIPDGTTLKAGDKLTIQLSSWKSVSKEGKPYLSHKCNIKSEVGTVSQEDVNKAWGSFDVPSNAPAPDIKAISDDIPF